MKTILVIEDEDAIRENLLRILNINGFRALGAKDGQSGIQQALDLQPDLVLCDVRMPHSSGYEVLTTLRTHPGTAATPFIFLSGYTSYAEIRQGMNLGADDYLTKPYTSQDLLDAIASCFRKKEVFAQPYLAQVQQVKDTLEKVSHWDSLTRLPNASLFRHQLQQLCQEAAITQESVAIVAIKITSYQAIKLTYGGEFGDHLLEMIADRLRTASLPGITARLNEDEFGLMLPDAGTAQDLEDFTDLLVNIITVPYGLQGQELRIQANLGVALYPEHSTDPAILLTQSTAAMQWSRQQGQSNYRIYSPEMAKIEAARHFMASDLAQAIDRSELCLHYQPQIDLATGCLTGVEALVRWHHPSRGVIAPSTFIQIAEEQGLIGALGEWVLRQACQQMVQWQRSVPYPLKLSVNLSMRQFQQEQLPDTIAQILQESGLNPRCLVLELTESCLMEQVSQTIHKLKVLKQLGINLAIDDFGTGYSSLSHLSQLPLDELKIDQSFTQKINHDRNATMIVSTIIAMAQSLNLQVVAEGVENAAQMTFLRQSGCHVGQGFFYAPALPPSELQSLLQNPQFEFHNLHKVS